jgi:subtilisin family serine protease
MKFNKIRNEPLRKIFYKSPLLGFKDIKGTGKLVRICVIDSGSPIHKDISVDEYRTVNFTSSGSVKDVFGHSTAVSGILAANGSVQGFAPKSDLFFAKALSDADGTGDPNSIRDSLLWSITKEVDIIIMAFGCDKEFPGLYDAIKKVYKSGISMFAAGGNCTQKTKDVTFPARYEEVFSVCYSSTISHNEIVKNNNRVKGIILPSQVFETTFVNSKYTSAIGSSMHCAAVTGISALLFEDLRHKGKNITNQQIIYNEIANVCIKD